MMELWEVLYCSCIHESGYHTVAICSSEEKARKALAMLIEEMAKEREDRAARYMEDALDRTPGPYWTGTLVEYQNYHTERAAEQKAHAERIRAVTLNVHGYCEWDHEGVGIQKADPIDTYKGMAL